MSQGKQQRMSTYRDGQLDSFNGVVPVIPNLLRWEYLDKTDGKWTVMSVEGKVKYQMACYGTEITKEQLKKLAEPQSTEKK